MVGHPTRHRGTGYLCPRGRAASPDQGLNPNQSHRSVGGLSPKLHGIAAGKLPPGAVVGRNSTNKRSRYFLCPAKGVNERYIFLLYALPHRLAVQPGFKGGPLFNKINTSALAHGLLTSSYKRA